MDDGRRFISSHLGKSKTVTSCDSSANTTKTSNEPVESKTCATNVSPKMRNYKRAVSSLTESALLVDILKSEGYEVIEAAGAGYKILAVIQGNYFFHQMSYNKVLAII